MGRLLSRIKKVIRFFLNIFAKYFLIVRTSIFRLASVKKNNNLRIAILGDYLGATFLFDSKELDNCEVGFILTNRYPFLSFLLHRRWKKLRFLHFVPDFGEDNYQQLLNYCQANKIDYVFIQAGDFLVPAYNYLNAELNGKGNAQVAVKCSLDKDYMRKILNNNGISVVKKVTLEHSEDFHKVDFYPCVIKPNIGTASEGIVLVKSTEEMQQALSASQAEKRNTEFLTSYLAEEYIEGRQFDVEGILVNGKVIILCIVEENYQGFFPYFNINWFLFNAFVSDALREKMRKTLKQAFEACGLKYGAYHCELKINALGEVKIIEFSNRMGGGFEASISKVTGNHFADLYVRSMLGKEVVLSKNNNLFLLEKYFRNTKEYNAWKRYLHEHHINYSTKPRVYRGQIAVLWIYHEEETVIKALGEHFKMDYIL